jgi:hypothetical protein
VDAARDRAVGGRLARTAGLFALSALAAYVAVNRIPFDAYRVAWERQQLLYLALYYSTLAVPFFFAGLSTGLTLSAWSGRANAVYAANLMGCAAGCLAALALIPLLGVDGTVVAAAALAALAAVAFASVFGHRWPQAATSYTMLAAVLPLMLLRPPDWLTLRL